MSWPWPARARPDRGDREGLRDQRIMPTELAGQSRRRGRPPTRCDHRRVGRAEKAETPEPATAARERGPAPSRGVSLAGEPAGKMQYPLVRELAVDGVPVAVTCRVLKLPPSPTTAGSPPRSVPANSTRPTWPMPCSTPTVTTRSSATDCWPMRPWLPARPAATAPCGGSAPPTSGGVRSGRNGSLAGQVSDGIAQQVDERELLLDCAGREITDGHTDDPAWVAGS